MLYTVEVNFTEPQLEAEWNAWYSARFANKLVVPGFLAAQRFRKVTGDNKTYLAAYSIADASVLTSQAYNDTGGAGRAGARWNDHIERNYNLFSGISVLPAVSDEARLLLTDTDPAGQALKDILFTPLDIAGLDRTVQHRYIAVISRSLAAKSISDRDLPISVYMPISQHFAATTRPQSAAVNN